MKEGKRALNLLLNSIHVYSNSSESNVTSCLAHVTTLSTKSSKFFVTSVTFSACKLVFVSLC